VNELFKKKLKKKKSPRPVAKHKTKLYLKKEQAKPKWPRKL